MNIGPQQSPFGVSPPSSQFLTLQNQRQYIIQRYQPTDIRFAHVLNIKLGTNNSTTDVDQKIQKLLTSAHNYNFGQVFKTFRTFFVQSWQQLQMLSPYQENVLMYFLNKYPAVCEPYIIKTLLDNSFLFIPSGIALEKQFPLHQPPQPSHTPRETIQVPYPKDAHFEVDLQTLYSTDYDPAAEEAKYSSIFETSFNLPPLNLLSNKPPPKQNLLSSLCKLDSSIDRIKCAVCGGSVSRFDVTSDDGTAFVCSYCLYKEFNRKLTDYEIDGKLTIKPATSEQAFDLFKGLKPWEQARLHDQFPRLPPDRHILDTILCGICPRCFSPLRPTYNNCLEVVCSNFDESSNLEPQRGDNLDHILTKEEMRSCAFTCILPNPTIPSYMTFLTNFKSQYSPPSIQPKQSFHPAGQYDNAFVTYAGASQPDAHTVVHNRETAQHTAAAQRAGFMAPASFWE